VEHHVELAEIDLEQPLEPLTRVLELGQDAGGVGRVMLVVAGDERLGRGLQPDGPSLGAGRIPGGRRPV
jgi:hypothetical protein